MTTYYGIEPGEEYKPWLWQVPEDAKYIGKTGTLRRDGKDKATGKAIFTRDVKIQGMLFSKPLLSPYAHAKIRSMDSSQAEVLPGVRKVIRYDHPLASNFISTEANCEGDAVGAIVVADSELACDEALRLIQQNTEWDELPFSYDWDTVLDAGAPLIYPDRNPDSNLNYQEVDSFGDVEQGLKEADNILEFELRGYPDTPPIPEGPCDIVRINNDGTGDQWGHQQFPDRLGAMGVQIFVGGGNEKVRYHYTWNGGLFGSPAGITIPNNIRAGLAAAITQRPVKHTYDNVFGFFGEEWGTYKFTVGYNNDGTITAVKVWTIQLCGSLVDQIQKINKGSKIANLEVTKVYAFHNACVSYGCYKHGSAQCLIQNEAYAQVADALGKDPAEIAIINDGGYQHDMEYINEHVKAVYGFDTTRDSLKEGLEVGKKAIDWDNKWHAPGTKILSNGNYHGIGFMTSIAWHHRPDDSDATYWDFRERFYYGPVSLRVFENGKVVVRGQHADCGFNVHATYAQIVADELGVSRENVIIRTDVPSQDTRMRIGGGSRGMCSNSPFLVRLAKKAKKRILEKVTLYTDDQGNHPFAGKTVDQLDIKNDEIFEIANPSNKITLAQMTVPQQVPSSPNQLSNELMVTDNPPVIDPNIKTYTMGRQCYFMEVEVDADTGEVLVKDLVIVNDVGKAINPETITGQQRGGAYMGLGRSRQAEVIFDPASGLKLNDNLIGYPNALMNDIPFDINCNIIETGLGWSAYGMFGVGESAGAMVSSLTRYAVHNAIGKWVDLKTTPARVLKALGKA